MTENKPSVSQVFARWMLGVETAAKDLVGASGADAPTRLATEREAPPRGDIDRLWAAAAHLAVFGGMWLVVPLVIYLLHRRGSPFVRWHAFQATVLAVWTVCACIIAGLVLGAGVLVMVLLDKLGLGEAGRVALLVGAAPLGFVLLFSVALSAIGGIRSLAGKPWTMPIIGRIASGMIAHKPRAAELPDGTA